jgi:hypothetical protein
MESYQETRLDWLRTDVFQGLSKLTSLDFHMSVEEENYCIS